MPSRPAVTLRSLCDAYGRDRSQTRKALLKMGVELELDVEYVGGQKILWVYQDDVALAVAYLSRSLVVNA